MNDNDPTSQPHNNPVSPKDHLIPEHGGPSAHVPQPIVGAAAVNAAQHQPPAPQPMAPVTAQLTAEAPQTTLRQTPTQQPTTPSPIQQPAAQQTENKPEASTGNVMVLQWLTYAFWLWTICTISILMSIVLLTFLGDANTGSSSVYTAAALLVLLPISYFCDRYYSKVEPLHKKGGASVIMLVHAVLFGLITVGSLIAAMFTLISLITETSDGATKNVTLMTSLTISGLYGLAMARTLDLKQTQKIKSIFRKIMVGFTTLLLILAIVGPVTKSFRAKNDNQVGSSLQTIHEKIQEYASDNDKLPEDLGDLDLKSIDQKMIDKDLISYKPEGLLRSDVDSYTRSLTTPTYKYQLCGDFKEKSSYYYESRSSSNSAYSTYLSTYQHKAGENCFKLKTSNY